MQLKIYYLNLLFMKLYFKYCEFMINQSSRQI